MSKYIFAACFGCFPDVKLGVCDIVMRDVQFTHNFIMASDRCFSVPSQEEISYFLVLNVPPLFFFIKKSLNLLSLDLKGYPWFL